MSHTDAGASPISSEPTQKQETTGQVPTQILKHLGVVAQILNEKLRRGTLV
jgi:hypothetical protein